MTKTASLNVLYRIGVISILLTLFVMGAVSIFSINRTIEQTAKIISDPIAEMHHVMKLQLSLQQAAMPVNDHVIHADPVEQENYLHLKGKVAKEFDELLSLKSLFPEQRDGINKALLEWQHAIETGDAIMKMENPIGDQNAANKMEFFDKNIDIAVSMLEHVHHQIQDEISERQELLHEIRHELYVLIITMFAFGLFIVVIGFIVLARLIFSPLKTVTHSMDRFSQGELDHRIEGRMVTEIKHLADGFNSMADSIHDMQSVLERQGIEDPLTGCFNRRKLQEDMKAEFSRAKRLEENLSILMIDLDHFKVINDTYGHLAGDIVLKAVVSEMNHQLRNYDTLYRYGGEEFAAMLPEINDEQARVVAERIRNAVSNTQIRIDADRFVSITTSIGIATYPDAAVDGELILKLADQAVYEAKDRGRNLVCHIKDCS
jgi:diguanylate cyclase (GGDEF)-like protein